jgi:hypothetical protein
MEAPESIEEMRAFCNAAPNTPKMANMIEGGKTPILSPAELERLGFKLAVYSVTLLSSAVAAMNRALADLKACRPVAGLLPFSELCCEVGFPEYYVDDERYALDDKEQVPPPLTPHPPPSHSAPIQRPLPEPASSLRPSPGAQVLRSPHTACRLEQRRLERIAGAPAGGPRWPIDEAPVEEIRLG